MAEPRDDIDDERIEEQGVGAEAEESVQQQGTKQEKPREPMSFKPYTSFEVLTPALASEVRGSLRQEDQWVVTEKVHGANFSFRTDGVSVACAKRTAPLTATSTFYNFLDIQERYSTNIKHAFQIVKSLMPETNCLWVFGELYGGSYPHNDVPAKPGALRVQQFLWYSPNNEFYAFDLSTGTGFLDYDVCLRVFHDSGIPCAEPLFIGSFEQAIAHPVVFPTTIPARHGLPAIPGNEAEGIVVKRVRKSRPIFKLKAERFSEITGVKKGQEINKQKQRDKQAGSTTQQPPPPPLPEEAMRAERYVNVNRLQSVISKEGQVTAKDAKRLTGLLAKDAMDDFVKDELEAMGKPRTDPTLWKLSVPREISQRCGKHVAHLACQLVDAHFN